MSHFIHTLVDAVLVEPQASEVQSYLSFVLGYKGKGGLDGGFGLGNPEGQEKATTLFLEQLGTSEGIAELLAFRSQSDEIAETLTIAALELEIEKMGRALQAFSIQVRTEIFLFPLTNSEGELVDVLCEDPEGTSDCPNKCADHCGCEAISIMEGGVGWGNNTWNPSRVRRFRRILELSAAAANMPTGVGVIRGVKYIVSHVTPSPASVTDLVVTAVHLVDGITNSAPQLWVKFKYGECKTENCKDWFSVCLIGWRNVTRLDCRKKEKWVRVEHPNCSNPTASGHAWEAALSSARFSPTDAQNLEGAMTKAIDDTLAVMNALRGNCENGD